jgi:hypothetical protein
VLKDSGGLDVPALKAKLRNQSLDTEYRIILENLLKKEHGR